MLDKKDVKTIQGMIINSLGEFFEKVLSPYLDERFAEVDKRFAEVDKRFAEVDKRFDSQDEVMDKMLRKLE